MGLSPADLMQPPIQKPQGARVVRLLDEDKENDMPSGVYPRKPKGEAASAANDAAPTAKKRDGRGKSKAAKKGAPPPPRASRKAAASTAARFGVFDDGSVHINTGSCKGSLDAKEATQLVAFINRLSAK